MKNCYAYLATNEKLDRSNENLFPVSCIVLSKINDRNPGFALPFGRRVPFLTSSFATFPVCSVSHGLVHGWQTSANFLWGTTVPLSRAVDAS